MIHVSVWLYAAPLSSTYIERETQESVRALEEKSPVCEHRAGIMPGICIRMQHHGLDTPGEICSLADYAGVCVCVRKREKERGRESARARKMEYLNVCNAYYTKMQTYVHTYV